MGMDGSVRDAGRLVASPFLVKTYRLVDDPSTDHIVSWGDHKNTFVVWRPKEFSACVLPCYFNHTNFSSFVRQLNTYGFRKIVRGRCEFANDLFRKGQTHLLSHIQRRKPSSTSTTQASQIEYEKSSSSLIPYSLSTVQDSDVPAAAPSLSEENEILRRNNSLLLSEIARLQNICSRDLTLFSRQNTRNPPSIDMDRSKVDNASPTSSMTEVAEEINMTPPKLFGVPLY
jgi:heat shock transcription factor